MRKHASRRRVKPAETVPRGDRNGRAQHTHKHDRERTPWRGPHTTAWHFFDLATRTFPGRSRVYMPPWVVGRLSGGGCWYPQTVSVYRIQRGGCMRILHTLASEVS